MSSCEAKRAHAKGGERWVERRWEEMGGDGSRREQMGGDGRRWEEMGGDGMGRFGVGGGGMGGERTCTAGTPRRTKRAKRDWSRRAYLYSGTRWDEMGRDGTRWEVAFILTGGS
jgi:hypothetical protein